MDDNTEQLSEDCEVAQATIHNTIEALKLSGVDSEMIATHLISQGALIQLLNGETAVDLISEIEALVTGLADHISKK
ncbi:MAG: hypothetical protein COB59_07710 [Rhodospirillaceae bacterium]|nr:MAG: hypothetical protein COB59_07710 [Rhodospirillaceae bacterium]